MLSFAVFSGSCGNGPHSIVVTEANDAMSSYVPMVLIAYPGAHRQDGACQDEDRQRNIVAHESALKASRVNAPQYSASRCTLTREFPAGFLDTNAIFGCRVP